MMVNIRSKLYKSDTSSTTLAQLTHFSRHRHVGPERPTSEHGPIFQNQGRHSLKSLGCGTERVTEDGLHADVDVHVKPTLLRGVPLTAPITPEGMPRVSAQHVLIGQMDATNNKYDVKNNDFRSLS